MTLPGLLRDARQHPITCAAARIGAAVDRAVRERTTRPCEPVLLEVVEHPDDSFSVCPHVEVMHRGPRLGAPASRCPSCVPISTDELTAWRHLADVRRQLRNNPWATR